VPEAVVVRVPAAEPRTGRAHSIRNR
jgi:hypothetical protein